jgi:hypothetical protein
MAGQQNLRNLSQCEYQEQYLSTLLDEADKYYLNKNFLVDTNYSRHKRRHAQLMYDVVTNNTCELAQWITKKLQGQLEDTKYEAFDAEYLDRIYINNIINNYHTHSTWENVVEW